MSDAPTAEEIVASAQTAVALGLTDQETVVTPFKGDENKGVGIDWIVEKYKHHELVSIIFEHEDDEGFNVYTVCYNKKSKAD